ncbi:predicted protein [Enterococcus faecalis D6]|nr:predicted protein [Enterococcus faecalis D6]
MYKYVETLWKVAKLRAKIRKKRKRESSGIGEN